MPPQTPIEIRSLADVQHLIAQAEKIKPSTRKEMLSAISRLSKMLGHPLHDIPADLESLRALLKKLHPVQAKLSKKSLSNVKAALILALRFTGVASELRLATKETEQWAAFRHSGTASHHAYALSRFARFCTAQDIEPADVTDAVMGEYEARLAGATINCGPSKVRIETAKTFNCILKRSDSNRPLLNARKGTAYITPPLTVYPQRLQQEIETYLGRLADPDIFSEGDLAKPLRPYTLRNIKHHLRQVLDAAVTAGYEPSFFTGLEKLIDIKVVQAAFGVIAERSKHEVPISLLNIASSLLAIARHEVRAPDEDIRRLSKLKTRIAQRTSQHAGMSAKSERRMQQFEDPENVVRFICLPEQIFARARKGDLTRSTALEMMYAAAMTILFGNPMRASNLASIELGKHLEPVKLGRKSVYRLHISGEEVKNGVEILAEYHDGQADILRLYITKYRPLLSAEPGNYLFPKPSGGVRAAKHLSDGIKRFAGKYLGLEVSAHLFRHFAAYLFLEAHPGDYESTRRLVGHKKIDTTTAFYSPRSNRAAQKRYEAILASKRGGKT
ncbi:site-specific integrase [Sedimentimonas flavescens]|uniref:Site-specific integrase n=1 Tax=Sedimentimonas flavescens TaxID=2851012 RepID=A0ABT3A2Y6_9RHOB|nr:site-specific integrase [Sedimentimonas flavescens]MCV2880368.1 site-specific integrase [Sedimentimonas flavescens]